MNYKIWILLYLILFSGSTFSQPKNNSFNFSVGYSAIAKRPQFFGINSSGIRGEVAYQHKFFQMAFQANYNKILYYDETNSFIHRKMEDTFSRFGTSFNFRLFHNDRHAVYLGGLFNNFTLLNHHYYYESFTSNTLYEYNCADDDCPIIEGISGYEKFDYEINYKWQIGPQIKYAFRIWSQLHVNLIFQYTFVRGVERYEDYGGYDKVYGFIMTPSLNITYKIPFGEEYIKKSK